MCVARLFVLESTVCGSKAQGACTEGTGFGRGTYPDSVLWSSPFNGETIRGKSAASELNPM